MVGYPKITMIVCFGKLVGIILLQPDQNSICTYIESHVQFNHSSRPTYLSSMDLSWGAEPLTKNIAFEGHEQVCFPPKKKI